MESISKAVIGIRKMGVIMWCVMAIVVVVFLHLHYDKEISNHTIAIVTVIAGLGGVHIVKQGQIDSNLKAPENS
jgi:uncharacterized membrane protein